MIGAVTISRTIGAAAFLAAAVTLASPAQSWHTRDGAGPFDRATQSPQSREVPAQYRRQVVPIRTKAKPGTIIIDTSNHFLYLVLPESKALRYGVGVGREGFAWNGTARVGRKAEWPTWTPPTPMIKRQPHLAKYASGMPGGPDNPLGARALYLYRGGKDTLYRIHGTNEPWSIGTSTSSGCIRMLNEDVVDLFQRVPVGAKVVVL